MIGPWNDQIRMQEKRFPAILLNQIRRYQGEFS